MSSKRIITLVAAVTRNWKIARHSGEFTSWTSEEDKKFLHAHLDESDVVIVGNNTYKTSEAPLSKRNCIVFTRSVEATERRRDNLLMFNPVGASLEIVLENYQRVALLGGTQIYDYFFLRDLIDEMFITVESRIVFANGLDLFGGNLKTLMNDRFEVKSSKLLNTSGSILRHYKKRFISPLI